MSPPRPPDDGVLALLDALLHGLDGFFEGEPPARCCSGAQRTSVDHAVGGEVLDELLATRRSPSAVCMTAVVRSNVFRYSTSSPSRSGPRTSRRGRRHRRRHVEADLVGELDDRLRTQRAVEVIVQRHLRKRRIETPSSFGSPLVDGHGEPFGWRGMSGGDALEDERGMPGHPFRSPRPVEGVEGAGASHHPRTG
jgi:hypothetical protein